MIVLSRMPIGVLVLGAFNTFVCADILVVYSVNFWQRQVFGVVESLFLLYFGVAAISGILLLCGKEIGRRLTLIFTAIPCFLLWVLTALLVYQVCSDQITGNVHPRGFLFMVVCAILACVSTLYTAITYFVLTRKNVREYFNPPEQEAEETKAEEIT